jgi:RNA polymerase sigma-70 factor (family 1)
LSDATHTDDALLCAIRQDDEKAFAELFKRYWKKAYVMAYARVRSEEVTQEIVQDLFINIWDKRKSLTISHVPSYLYAAVKNRILNYLESQGIRRKHWEYYKNFIPAQDIVTEKQVGLNELMGAIENGLEGLTEKSKKVFQLSHLEGRSITEIAEMMHLSKKAIQYHLTQSTKKLRIHLKNYIILVAILVISFI